jgi:hypothetical protein
MASTRRLYIADLLVRIADHPARHIAELLPWNWQPENTDRARLSWRPHRALAVFRQRPILHLKDIRRMTGRLWRLSGA